MDFGVRGVVCDAHANEVTLLDREERRRVRKIVCEEVKGKLPVVAGAYGESTQMVIEWPGMPEREAQTSS